MAKSKYSEVKKQLSEVEQWAAEGMIDSDIARNLGISTSTFYDYQTKYSEFSESLKRGKAVIDTQVEDALLKRALGYSYTETVFEKIDSKVNLEITPDELITTDAYKKKITIKEVAPDTTAQIFWLKNRMPDRWRDKQETHHSGSIDTGLNLKGLSKEELISLAKIDSRGT